MKRLFSGLVLSQFMMLLLLSNGYAGNIGTADILGGAVTTPKLADGAVTTPKLADGAVTNEKISGMISAYKISSTGLDADTVDGLDAANFSLSGHSHSDLAALVHNHGSDDILGEIGVEKLGAYSGVKIVQTGSANNTNTFNSLKMALNSINDADISHRYVVVVMPGIYEEFASDPSERLKIQSYVDVIGASKNGTVLRLGDYLSISLCSFSSISDITIEKVGSGLTLSNDFSARTVNVSVKNCDFILKHYNANGIVLLEPYNSTFDGITIHKNTDLAFGDTIGLSVDVGRNSSIYYDVSSIVLKNIKITGHMQVGMYYIDFKNIPKQSLNIDNIYVDIQTPPYTYSNAINSYASSLTIRNSIIKNNLSSYNHGAVGSSLTVNNCEINRLYSQSSDDAITNSKISVIEQTGDLPSVRVGGSQIGSIVGNVKTVNCYNTNFDPI